MGVISFPTTTHHKIPFLSRSSNSHNPCFHRNLPRISCVFGDFHLPLFSRQALIHSSFSSRRTCRSRSLKARSSRSGEEDHRALETVLKLYTAIKNKNVRELSDVIADECRCVCNFISFFQPFQGKKQVLDFLSYLMRSLGNHIEFVVSPTLQDGMNVGVGWSLEWKTTHMPLGKGFSFYTCHYYKGKVVIRNMEMFIEPLLHFEPLRLKMMGFVLALLEKIHSKVLKGQAKRGAYILLTLLSMAAFIFFIKCSMY